MVNFANLTAGHVYQVQIWCMVQDGTNATVQFVDSLGNIATLDAGAHVPKKGALVAGQSYGQTLTGVFEAKDTTASIDFNGGDGTTYINRDLSPGDSYQVPNSMGMTLSTTNGGAVEVDLDGMSMGNAGADSQPADSLPLDPQSIVDHFNSHRPG